VDANVIGYLHLLTPYTALAERAVRKDTLWVAPWLWRSEVRNMLALYLRKGLLTLPDALMIIERAESLLQGFEREVSSVHVLRLAESSGCSAYDCEYVALAQHLGVPLVTQDRQLLRQFPNVAISLDTFVSL